MLKRLCLLLLIVCTCLLTDRPVSAEPATVNLRAYPVVPVMRGAVRSRALYHVRVGKRKGNRLNVFSKIGDSISAWDFYLKPIGMGQAGLGNYGDLADVIGTFSAAPTRVGNSFTNASLAAVDGWTTADLLDPAKADPAVCAPGETPVDCELRVTQPAVALIMVGTNDIAHGLITSFRANLNRIVTIVERHGVIPVVSTIPYRRDNPAWEQEALTVNDMIIRVALAHGAPIWNYWLAVEGLPANGVSIDGIHPSLPPDYATAIFDDFHLQFGFTMRNLTALQVLKALMPLLR